MFQRLILFLGVALALGTQLAAVQKCSDISTEWTISNTFVDGSDTTSKRRQCYLYRRRERRWCANQMRNL